MATECPAMRMRQAARVCGRVFDEAFRPLGIQATQLPVLCGAAMFGEKGVSIGGLAKATLVDPTTLTRNVRPLEKAGLVRVARSPEDARAKVVVLTRAGERLLEEIFPLWQKALKQLQAEFGATRLDDIRARLTPIVASAGAFVPPTE
jgi:DNA-binding MarR family transcriptional regulator